MGANKSTAVLLFGAPGVGKGTQGRVLNQILGFRHISSGDVFRGLDPDSEEGREYSQYSRQADRGRLVPDDVTIRIFGAVLQRQIETGEIDPEREVFIFDGIPRTVRQAEFLSDWVDVRAVLNFTFSDEDEPVMVERIKCRAEQENRPDDADESIIQHRFQVYRKETAPVLAFYPPDRLHAINSLSTPVEVLRDICNVLAPIYREKLEAAGDPPAH